MLEFSKGKPVISHRLQEKLSILKVSFKLELNRKISICTYDMMKCEDYGDLTPVEKYFAVSDITNNLSVRLWCCVVLICFLLRSQGATLGSKLN